MRSRPDEAVPMCGTSVGASHSERVRPETIEDKEVVWQRQVDSERVGFELWRLL